MSTLTVKLINAPSKNTKFFLLQSNYVPVIEIHTFWALLFVMCEIIGEILCLESNNV